MADKRISQLNPHTSPSGSDLLAIVNNNETKKITYADLTAGIAGNQIDISGLNAFTESFNSFSASVHTEILAGTNEQDLSGLVTSVTLGILSGSVDSRLDHIEAKTGSFATTGSNVFKGNQTISGSLNVVIPGGSATGMNENPTSNNIFWSYIPQDTNTTSIEVGWNAVADGFGSYIVTDVQYNDPFIYITLNDDVNLPYRIRLNFSKPSHLWQFNENGAISFPDNTLQTTAFTGIPNGIVSSSQQITDLGFISTSADIADFTFSEQTISNSNIILDATNDITLHTGNGNIILNPDGNAYIGSANAGNGIVTDGYLAGIIGDTNTVNNSTGHTLTDNLTNIINSIPTISTGTISGSQQITDLGFISYSQTGSFATTGSNQFNGNQTITGSLTINVPTGIPTNVTNWVGQGGWNQGYYSNISTTGGTGTGLTVDVAAGGGGYIGIGQITINNPGSGYTNGDIITIDNENNLPGQFTLEVGANNFEFDTSGSLVFPDTTRQTTAFIPTEYVTTSSFDNFTSSYFTDSSSFDNRVLTEKGRIDAILSASTANADTFAEIVTLINSVDTTNDNAFASYYTSSNARISSLESNTSSYETTGRGILSGSISYTFLTNVPNDIVSGSTQLTSSFDTRYTLSGSVPSGTISSSAQLPNGLISGSSQLTASYDTRYTLSGSVQNVALPSGLVSSSTQISNYGFISSSHTDIASLNAFTASYTTDSASFDSRISSLVTAGVPAGTVSGSSQLTSSYDTRYTLSGSVQPLPANLVSSSAQITNLGFISSSADITSLNSFTASYFTDSSSFNNKITSLVNNTGSYETIGRGIISESVVTISDTTPSVGVGNLWYDSNIGNLYLKYDTNTWVDTSNGVIQTIINDGSLLTTASFNAWTGSINTLGFATTGSNTFKGNQTISSSLFINSGSLFPQKTGSALVSYDLTTGQLYHTPYQSTLASLFAIGAFYSTGSITATANTSGSFQFDTSLGVNAIAITSGSHINIDKTATYNFQFSIQISQGSQAADVAVWLKKNGINVSDTATYVTVPSNQKYLMALNLWDSGNAGDYYELAYQSTNNNTTFATIPASGNIPRSPGIILTINQVR